MQMALQTVKRTYQQHVIATSFAALVPDFTLLFGIKESWPSLTHAQEFYYKRVGMMKSALSGVQEEDSFRSFVEVFLSDLDTYSIARKMWCIENMFKEKDSKAFDSMWDLRLELMQRPTLLPLFPEGLLNAFRASERPKRRSMWGTIQITKRHKISCAVCVNTLEEDCYRSRCQCNHFGSLVHYACIKEKKCLVCSTPKAITKVGNKRKQECI